MRWDQIAFLLALYVLNVCLAAEETLGIPGGRQIRLLRRLNDSPVDQSEPQILNRGRRANPRQVQHSGEVMFRKRSRIFADDGARVKRLLDNETVESMLLKKLPTLDEEGTDPFEIRTFTVQRPTHRTRII
ncbi:unnamed protein product [Bursaphelenchus xylophilus]|uniref:(pine wood nematode) hypothetical protein n=1 Tax=Bursaphelenchus xylophilus TaxID=6326 RepID=A0A1I7RNK1_BURXY|nr:unnamed protein product [Bursaphelenchus xylophilus]CAG9124105.1 unnamed protein product [Bursaphelenchus xylophilus]